MNFYHLAQHSNSIGSIIILFLLIAFIAIAIPVVTSSSKKKDIPRRRHRYGDRKIEVNNYNR
ncbi:MAG: hypothetical protein JST96_01885 [Bacteroidetes bacterium]|nr:hypothetical protein [Bacteroidota bacterium]